MIPDDLCLLIDHLTLEERVLSLVHGLVLQLLLDGVLQAHDQLAHGLVVRSRALVLAGGGHGAVGDAEDAGRRECSVKVRSLA